MALVVLSPQLRCSCSKNQRAHGCLLLGVVGQRVEGQLARRDAEGGWRASYALANFYRDGSESVAAHSGARSPPSTHPDNQV